MCGCYQLQSHFSFGCSRSGSFTVAGVELLALAELRETKLCSHLHSVRALNQLRSRLRSNLRLNGNLMSVWIFCHHQLFRVVKFGYDIFQDFGIKKETKNTND